MGHGVEELGVGADKEVEVGGMILGSFEVFETVGGKIFCQTKT
jgi:hypothetical protein